MKKLRKVGFILLAISILMILTGILLTYRNNIHKERCFNLPVNDFFEDESCRSYIDGE